MAITLETNNTIRVQFVPGDAVGDSFANPYTFDDIITASDNADAILISEINNTGSGYEVGDTFTVDGGTASGVVTEIDETGGITDYSFTLTQNSSVGSGYSIGTGYTTTTTTGSGTGFIIDITEIGWGCKKSEGDVYYIPLRLEINGVDTYFKDYGICIFTLETNWNISIVLNFVNCNVQFSTSGSRPYKMLFCNLYTTGGLGFSNVNGSFNHVTFNGFGSQSNKRVTIYGGSIHSLDFNTCEFYACGRILPTTNITPENTKFINCNIYFRSPQNSFGQSWLWELRNAVTFDRVNFGKSTYVFLAQLGNLPETSTFNNITVETEFLSISWMRLRLNSSNKPILNFIDSFVPRDDCTWYGQNDTTDARIDLNWLTTFIIKTNTPDCDYILYDKEDNIISEGIISGSENEEPITYYSEVVSSALGTTDVVYTKTEYDPLRLVISKQGYETLEIEDVNIIDGQPTIINATLKKSVPLLIDKNGQPHIRLNKENIGKNRDILI